MSSVPARAGIRLQVTGRYLDENIPGRIRATYAGLMLAGSWLGLWSVVACVDGRGRCSHPG
jgi:hypothetical protein